MQFPPEIISCLPERLHPVSRLFLEYWLEGAMTTSEFLRWFHMPKSAYLPVGKCIVAALGGG